VLYRYWSFKKEITSEAEPQFIQEIFKRLCSLCSGLSLGGAGGGGFAILILRKDQTRETVSEVIESFLSDTRSHDESKTFTLYDVEVDDEGLANHMLAFPPHEDLVTALID
jgi:galactokinase/mevalonate kinase-like predicted kinase